MLLQKSGERSMRNPLFLSLIFSSSVLQVGAGRMGEREKGGVRSARMRGESVDFKLTTGRSTTTERKEDIYILIFRLFWRLERDSTKQK